MRLLVVSLFTLLMLSCHHAQLAVHELDALRLQQLLSQVTLTGTIDWRDTTWTDTSRYEQTGQPDREKPTRVRHQVATINLQRLDTATFLDDYHVETADYIQNDREIVSPETHREFILGLIVLGLVTVIVLLAKKTR